MSEALATIAANVCNTTTVLVVVATRDSTGDNQGSVRITDTAEDGRLRIPAKVSSPFPLAEVLENRVGSRHRNAARAETTGCVLASHRAFDSQPRYRLG